MKHAPTDLQILKEIYERYYDTFAAYTDEKPNRDSRIFVPIDIDAVAGKLGVDGDIVFGRLYYHLNKKHGYKEDDGSYVMLFTPRAGSDRHCVNFPLMGAVLADLSDESRKFWWSTVLALLSLIVSIVSLVVAFRV